MQVKQVSASLHVEQVLKQLLQIYSYFKIKLIRLNKILYICVTPLSKYPSKQRHYPELTESRWMVVEEGQVKHELDVESFSHVSQE